MERRLLEAARKGNIHELDELISGNEQILEEMALEGAGHTPLHVACVGGHLDFVREFLKRMPKLAEKVNPHGFSPLHIAAARGDVEIAEELLNVGTHLCSVKGRERRIPLHNAAENGEVNVMERLLSRSPESVEETTALEETALHLAVKSKRFDAVVMLVKHLKQHNKEQVINWKDHKGNTALHLATVGKNFEVLNFLLRGHAVKSGVVEVNALNDCGLTPLDVSTFSQRGARDREIREILTRAGAVSGGGRLNSPASRPVLGDDDDIERGNDHRSDGDSNKGKESLGEIRNDLLVVAALIVSATYQSVLQPPSSLKVNDDNNDSNKLTQTYPPEPAYPNKWTEEYRPGLVYNLFLGGNTFGFLMSVHIIICLTKTHPVNLPLMLSLIGMVLTYFSFTLSLIIESPHDNLTTIVLNVLPLIIGVFLLLMQRPLAAILRIFLKWLSQFHCLGNLYKLEQRKD
ncbi:hypothetical protein BT93_E1280 [Corymbia citriodora subsp. variegata]|nr:hypothetical protein BT93_E1280 [Corymbia citriodora subsp. variegata]